MIIYTTRSGDSDIIFTLDFLREKLEIRPLLSTFYVSITSRGYDSPSDDGGTP